LSAGDDDYDADLDDDNDYNDFNGHPNKGKKGGLRSPLLGGGEVEAGGKQNFPTGIKIMAIAPKWKAPTTILKNRCRSPHSNQKPGELQNPII